MARLTKSGKQKLRHRMISTALKIVKDEGAGALNMRKLALAANVSPTTIYNTFETKSQLLTEVILSDLLSDIATLQLTPSAHDTVETTLRNLEILAQHAVKKEKFIHSLLTGLILNNEVINTNFSDNFMSPLIQVWLNDKVKSKVLKKNTNVALLTQQIISTIIANLVLWIGSSLRFGEMFIHVEIGLLAALERTATIDHKREFNNKIEQLSQSLTGRNEDAV